MPSQTLMAPSSTLRCIRLALRDKFDLTGQASSGFFGNIHPSMSAIIVVMDSKYFTMTDRAAIYFRTWQV